jgi:hypothetical protein
MKFLGLQFGRTRGPSFIYINNLPCFEYIYFYFGGGQPLNVMVLSNTKNLRVMVQGIVLDVHIHARTMLYVL